MTILAVTVCALEATLLCAMAVTAWARGSWAFSAFCLAGAATFAWLAVWQAPTARKEIDR